MNRRDRRDLTNEIQQYVALNPTAADTAEGVRQFWLPMGDAPLDAVQVALDQLEAAGILDRVRLPNGHVIYGAMGGQGDR